MRLVVTLEAVQVSDEWRISGCVVRPIEDAQRVVRWLFEGEELGVEWELKWALLYTTEGVVWMKYESGKWVSAVDEFSEIVPPLEEQYLVRAHIFGPEAEIRLWRRHDGLAAVSIVDDDSSDLPQWLRPADQRLLLFGNTVLDATESGFSLIATRSGSRQVVPLPEESLQVSDNFRRPRLRVRQYFAQDPEYGLSIPQLTRLVDLEVES